MVIATHFTESGVFKPLAGLNKPVAFVINVHGVTVQRIPAATDQRGVDEGSPSFAIDGLRTSAHPMDLVIGINAC